MTVRPDPVALLASRLTADEKRLLTALDRRSVPYEQVDPRTLWLDPAAPPRWRAALNREIGYHRARQAARGLEAAGVPVVNSAEATEVCGDKWRTTLALGAAGLPTPRTVLALTPDAALAALDDVGYPAVIKPLVGSWGRLVTLVPDRPTGETVLEYVAALPSSSSHLVYVQAYVDKPERDIRALVLGDEVVAAMYRRGRGWRTNVALGGRGEYCELDSDAAKLAVRAARAVGAQIAGVDLIEDATGAVHVIEVNHRVEFSGLQAAVGDRVDLADRIIDMLLEGLP